MVFVLKQWTSSTRSAGSSRVRGSLPNQSSPTCVLWTWRRHLTVSFGECCGGFSRIMDILYRSQSLVRKAVKSDLFPVRIGPILFITFMDRISRHSQGVEGIRFGDLRMGLCSLQMLWSCWLHQSVTSNPHWIRLQLSVK